MMESRRQGFVTMLLFSLISLAAGKVSWSHTGGVLGGIIGGLLPAKTAWNTQVQFGNAAIPNSLVVYAAAGIAVLAVIGAIGLYDGRWFVRLLGLYGMLQCAWFVWITMSSGSDVIGLGPLLGLVGFALVLPLSFLISK